MNYVKLLILILLTIILTEIAAYFWHIFSHEDYSLWVRQTHKFHHVSDVSHEAHGDFFWVVVLLLGLGVILAFLVFMGKISLVPTLVVYITAWIVFLWNWYIHSAYHIEDHWLNQYEWFCKDKEIHFQHHINPRANYSIASHFSDKLFGSYQEPEVEKFSYRMKRVLKSSSTK